LGELLGPPIAATDGECRREVSARGLAGENQTAEVTAVSFGVVGDPFERGADVRHGCWVWVLRREPVVDVECEVAGAREREPHQPMRVLRQEIKRTSVHVEHDGQGARTVRRSVDVEPVARVAGAEVLDVPDHLNTMLGRVGPWVKPAEA
jgi:hypothetical protein